MRFPILITACLFLTATFAPAQGLPVQSSRSDETAAGVILLPPSLPGTVAYPNCDRCSTRYYAIDANTHLYIGEEPVSLDQMRAEIIARPTALAMVGIEANGRRIRTIYIVPHQPVR